MGVFLTFIVIMAIVGWTIYVQIGARQQADVETRLAESDAAQLVRDYFGVLWTVVDGPGHINYRPKLRVNAPVLSVSFTPDGTRECAVSVWTSHWTTRYGVMAHAQLAWRKKLALASRLRNASIADIDRTRGA